MNTITNLRAEIFEDIVALRNDFLKASKYWKKNRCLFSERIYRQSAKKLGSIINYRKNDAAVRQILEEITGSLVLHENDAMFYEAKRESLDFASRTFKLLPKGSSLQLKLFITNNTQ